MQHCHNLGWNLSDLWFSQSFCFLGSVHIFNPMEGKKIHYSAVLLLFIFRSVENIFECFAKALWSYSSFRARKKTKEKPHIPETNQTFHPASVSSTETSWFCHTLFPTTNSKCKQQQIPNFSNKRWLVEKHKNLIFKK